MINGKFGQYHSIPKTSASEYGGNREIILKMRKLFDEAVKKRVDTDLPVGVYFSGGLDSASVLATARKYKKDLIAITIGHPGSPDMMAAKRYCGEFRIPHLTIDPPSAEELMKIMPKVVKITESFEPGVLRGASITYFISELARKKGLRVVLCGEGSDELFAGYRAFNTAKDDSELSELLDEFIAGLPRTQFQRVDRMSMCNTVEVRLPFFDTEFADYAIGIPPGSS
jgi:asparagine synthase (glutamine-hydrolysing)